jgi:hypothetical protein
MLSALVVSTNWGKDCKECVWVDQHISYSASVSLTQYSCNHYSATLAIFHPTLKPETMIKRTVCKYVDLKCNSHMWSLSQRRDHIHNLRRLKACTWLPWSKSILSWFIWVPMYVPSTFRLVQSNIHQIFVLGHTGLVSTTCLSLDMDIFDSDLYLNSQTYFQLSKTSWETCGDYRRSRFSEK